MMPAGPTQRVVDHVEAALEVAEYVLYRRRFRRIHRLDILSQT